MKKNIQLEKGWKNVLQEEFGKNYMQNLIKFLIKEKVNYTIYPNGNNIFNAFNSTPFNNVKVVILGQDPYHGKGQANGLSFSVSNGIKTPPSLVNIFKEIEQDLNIPIPDSGNLQNWADEGVLLLNSVLTVQEGKAHSHKGIGWEKFTDQAIQKLSVDRHGLVFLLWGNSAQEKEKLIDLDKHLVLKTVHPSPLSAYRGFFGSKHFSKSNNYLKKNLSFGYIKSPLTNEEFMERNMFIEVEKKKYPVKILINPLKQNKFKNI